MKRIILVALFLLFPLLAYAQPSILFDSEKYDFGPVSDIDTIEHIFEFTNTGDKELIIDKVIAS
ncbi:MAG: DUF1573 domain-containing protein [Nitrospira sp.]|nr:DUF1573 domain-containing protein [Nitrospira sp.]